MQIPVETMSPVMLMPRTGSGIITMPRAPAKKDDFLFSKLLQTAQTDADPQKLSVSKAPGAAADGRKAAQMAAFKRGKFDELAGCISTDDMSAAAGIIMGNQSKVATILEGDMKSGTDPESGIIVTARDAEISIYGNEAADETIADTLFDTAADAGANASAGAVQGGADRQAESGVGDAMSADAAAAEAAIAAANAAADAAAEAAAAASKAAEAAAAARGAKADADDEQAMPVYAAGEAADTDQKIISEASDAPAGAADAQGDVTARMPAIRTSERAETEERGNKPAASGDGYLSPLENESDKTRVKGRKEREFTKDDDAGDSAAKAADKPADNIVPVSTDIKPDRFRSDMQMAEAPGAQAASAPVRPENLFDEMVAKIETDATETTRTMTIQLKPEFLGKVALEIAMDAAGLHLKINAEDQGVRSMVNSQINALIESLQNKGIEVAEVEVTYTGVDNGAFADPKKRDAQPDSPKRAHRAEILPEDMTIYSALPLEAIEYYVDEGVSSVEYRA